MVSGTIPADTFALDGQSLAVVERTIQHKRTMVAPTGDDGTEQRPVPAARRDEPSLSDPQLVALGELAQAVQKLEGGHRDIEFAVVDGTVYLLQARPVTGLDGDESAGEEGAEDAGAEDASSAERFPVEWDDPADEQHFWRLNSRGPLRRLDQDIRAAYQPHLKQVFEDTGVPMARMHISRVVNGYQYARSPDVSEQEVAGRQKRHNALGDSHAERGTSYYEAVIEPETLAILERLGPFRRPARESLTARVEHFERALESAAHVFGDLHWRMAGAGGGQPPWPQTFHELTGEPAIDSGVLL